MKKRILIQIITLITVLSVLSLAHTAEAGIIRNGDDYDAISNIDIPDPDGQKSCSWYSAPDDNAIVTPWDHGGDANHYSHCLYVEYHEDLTRGIWRIGLKAKNDGSLMSSEWYRNFEVLVEIGSLDSGMDRLRSSVIKVRASDTQVKYGSTWVWIPKNGPYWIKYTWLNDKAECTEDGWEPGDDCDDLDNWFDANIMVHSVFFIKLGEAGLDD